MYIHLLLTLLSTTTASPLLPVDSASLPDLTDFQLDPVLNDETVLSSNQDPGLVGQTQPPPSGISTSEPPRIESGLGPVHVQPSFPSSSSDMAGSRFELTQYHPAGGKVAPVGERTTDGIYLCCEWKGKNEFLCDYRER